MLSERGVDEIRPDLRWLVTDKFPIWVEMGADRERLIDICMRVESPFDYKGVKAGWTNEFTNEGRHELNKARQPSLSAAEKVKHYRSAATYFGIAKFPFISTPAKTEAYEIQRSALKEASKYLDYRFEDIRIPFEGEDIVGYLSLPKMEKEITLPEAVLVTGGAEFFKEDLVSVANAITGSGMACMLMDMPGTGESRWKLSPEADVVYFSAVKHLACLGGIDVNRIGIMGIGFGGYWALRAAACCPEIKAVVNCGSPVHNAFNYDSLRRLPDYLKRTLAYVQSYEADNRDDIEKALKSMEEYSLMKCIAPGQISCPVLSINGENDPYVAIEDLFMLREEGGIRQEEWIFEGDGHCAPNRYKEWMPRACIWLANRLGGEDRIPYPDIAPL